MIKISIITINFNNAAGLKRTLESIKNLKCPDGVELESIVVDGASKDNSVDIVKLYSDIVTYYVSEPDNGIYDAMNKGIRMASGHWLNFMNSGDCFFSESTIIELDNNGYFRDENILLFFGGNVKNGVLFKPQSIEIAKNGIIPGCHQSMFFKNIGCYYNMKYRIYSDFDYFLEYYLNNEGAVKQVDVIISDSELDGIGSKVTTTKRRDKLAIMYSRFGLLHTCLVYLKESFHRIC